MFTELKEMAKSTSINIMISAEPEEKLRVIVMPKAAKEGENPALSTPLSLVGTPEELDEKFASIITGYTASRTSLAESLSAAQAVMEAAKADAAKTAAKKTASKPTEKAKPSAATTSDSEPDEEKESEIDLF